MPVSRTGAFQRDKKRDKFDWVRWGAVTKEYLKSTSKLDAVRWANIFDGARRFMDKEPAKPVRQPEPEPDVIDFRACLESDAEGE